MCLTLNICILYITHDLLILYLSVNMLENKIKTYQQLKNVHKWHLLWIGGIPEVSVENLTM